ncbi:MAG TPA: hypothetical protein VFD66_03220, partial [Verrucomicrobiae bacterium]|nr:hypothetical protein [Verrucomicrobiae bacterium]
MKCAQADLTEVFRTVISGHTCYSQVMSLLLRRTLTPALSHPMGEGERMDALSANHVAVESKSFGALPSPVGRERARVRAAWHYGCSLAALGVLVISIAAAASPSIEITNVPPFGSSAVLGGRVVDALPASYRVAVFIYVPSAGWWSKPYFDPQLTVIQPDGSWTADITTGGADASATRITVLLVGTNYSEPCVMGPADLPTNVLAQAVASATVHRIDPSVRWISFSGYDWWVKDSPG